MKLNELSTIEIKRMGDATEKTLGPDCYEVRVLRAELSRRKHKRAKKDAGCRQ
jgi:hypothetical protein